MSAGESDEVNESDANLAALQDALPPEPLLPPAHPTLNAPEPLRTGIASGACIGIFAFALQPELRGDGPVWMFPPFAAFDGALIGILAGYLSVPFFSARDPFAIRALVLSGAALAAAVTTACGAGLFVIGTAPAAYLAAAIIACILLPRVWNVPGLCAACGYDLRASQEFRRCPECGREFDALPWYARQTPHAPRLKRLAAWSLRHPYRLLLVFSAVLLLRPVWADAWHAYYQARFDASLRDVPAGTLLDLNALPFKWDCAYFFDPYTTDANIDSALGFHWPDAATTGITFSDHYSIAVFVRDRRVVTFLKLDRGGSYEEVVPSQLLARPIDKSQAQFILDKDNDGNIRLTPAVGPDSRRM